MIEHAAIQPIPTTTPQNAHFLCVLRNPSTLCHCPGSKSRQVRKIAAKPNRVHIQKHESGSHRQR
jgi:hypothetical protein